MFLNYVPLIAFVVLFSEPLRANVVVKLPKGLIQGREALTINNKTHYAFEKIPYAAPPIGELRFKAPVPPVHWEGILDTLHLNVSCYQTGPTYDYETEDCLYLNIFTPTLPSGSNKPSLPVMLYIYGGGFVVGSAIGLKSDFIIEEDIILVVISYRLGPFGFLSTQDDVIPGNNGLKDQQFAIKWVRDNIDLFGGDPNKVTVFGQSAGASSVSYQLLNQESKSLFRSAILQSGTALTPMAFQRNSRKIAFATAGFLNESFSKSDDSKALLDFLLSVDAKKLDQAAEEYLNIQSNPLFEQLLQGYYWAPVVEVNNPDAFLTKKMYGLLKEGNTIGVPILIGTTSEESIGLDNVKTNLKAFDKNLAALVPNDMQIICKHKLKSMGRKIRKMYTGGDAFYKHLGDGIRYFSDTTQNRAAIKHAELYSKFYKTYFYQFSYDGQLGGTDVHYENASTVGHFEDMHYLFCLNTGCDLNKFPKSDQITSQRMIKLWTNFAKYLNPTPEASDLLQNITWPLLSTETGDFLYLNINDTLEVLNRPREETYRGWVKLYDSLRYDDFDTY